MQQLNCHSQRSALAWCLFSYFPSFLSAGLVLQHQKEMKRLDSFRDRFGVDWLQYKRHLEEHDQVPVICRSRSADEIVGRPAAMDLQSESSDPEQGKPQVSQKESSPPLHDTEKEKEPEVQLNEPVEGEQREEEADELMLGEEEEEKPEGKQVLSLLCLRAWMTIKEMGQT